ncbi:Endonuclease MutS2 [Candidatus Ecksteinia adelgidicola]|nr:Endonuclease MutS2 [Candidatus Ecksteinia adelgidicola]
MRTKQQFILSQKQKKLFRESVSDAKKIQQDTINNYFPKIKLKQKIQFRLEQEQINASHYFSKEYQSFIKKKGPTRYIRPGYDLNELKKLRSGRYFPEVFLDLHGLNQKEAKKELGMLIVSCKYENIYCACVIHGHGKEILKQQIPVWLVQHPDVMAFHQAPKSLGNDAAILFLLSLLK